ncbi:E3 ubiquitin-protein ligase RNF13 [Hondaea fermentalgiana]|uniref:E3 ubiquitin-protein ligase RNF13 n=1 Tax=Hondaea fermentalgiana TaxID=2315210 RepID=A0A2R5GL14_9STRA|nr:E3 ubiquitin-protein ligase RNF13 [Hondaea fermentalgiana]|eukprot:GBG31596.1 E3 ubiquitin-protein ligase RNF13 [Hondaea fermentalgiana]
MPASFGPRYAGEEGVTGQLYDTGADEDPFLCDVDTTVESMNGKIAFVPRGRCRFVDKVFKAQNSGATGIIVYNKDPPLDGYTLVHMSADSEEDAAEIFIPAIFTSFMSAEGLFQLLDETEDEVFVTINGTDEFDPALFDETPGFMNSIFFLLQLLLVLWSIIAIFYLVNWVRLRMARRRRLEVVRKLPTRVFRAAGSEAAIEGDLDPIVVPRDDDNDDTNASGAVAQSSSGAIASGHGASAGTYEQVPTLDDEVKPVGGELALVDMGATRTGAQEDCHPRHPGHHRVPVDEVEVEIAGSSSSACSGNASGNNAGTSSSSAASCSTGGGITDYFACDNCVICICDFEDGEKLTVLPCGHGYHKECIEPWLIHKSSLCPICKQSILPSGDARSLDEIAASDATSGTDDSSRSVAIILAGVIAIATGSMLLYFMQIDA